jgi:hypothetical protein
VERGNYFHKISNMVQKLRRGAKWLLFADLAKVFEANLVQMQRAAERATGQSSLSGQLLILPPFLQDKRANGGHIILP